MADTLAERVLKELPLRSVREDQLGSEDLVIAVTPFPKAGVHQLQLAERYACSGGDVPFHHYVREIITIPKQPHPNVVDYLVQPTRSGHTRTSRKGQNPHALSVTAFYDFDPSFVHPLGERWRNETRRPNLAGYEVRAAFDTLGGVRYVMMEIPVREGGKEEIMASAISSVLARRYWKEVHFLHSEQFKDDLGRALKMYIPRLTLSTLTTGELRSTMEGLACSSLYADLREVSDHQKICLSSGTSKKAFSGGRVEFAHVVFRDALQKVAGKGVPNELQLLRADFTYVPAGTGAEKREVNARLYCA